MRLRILTLGMVARSDDSQPSLLVGTVKIPQHVVYRDFPAETVVLNLETERYFGLNPTAGEMLRALDQAGSVRAAARLVAEKFGKPRSEVEGDLCALCESLIARGLIEFSGAAG